MLPKQTVPNGEHSTETVAVAKNELYSNYEAFRGDIANLVGRYHGYGYGKIDHEAFVGNGAQTAVFMLHKNGQDYVVKIPRGVNENREAWALEVEANARVKGVQQYEQYVAVSSEGVVVSEYVGGSDMFDVTAEDLKNVTSDQINTYVQAIIEGHTRGVALDPKPGNVIYNAEKGFTIIDIGAIEYAGEEYRVSPAVALAWGAQPLEYAGFGDPDKGKHIDLATTSELAKAKLPLLELYAISIRYQLDQKYHDDVLLVIDTAIAELRRQADAEAYKREIEAERYTAEQLRQSALNYDPAKHGVIDNIF